MEALLSLGLDIGTTTISCLVADMNSGYVLESRTQKHDGDILCENPGEKIQSVERIEMLAMEMVQQLLEKYPAVACIGLTGQMHGILYLDPSGKPVSPLYTWQDQRGSRVAAYLKEQTGYTVAPGYGLATHCALQAAGEVPSDAWKLCTIMDYLAYKLCGAKTLWMHTTNAASLGLFRLAQGEFDGEALEKVGIKKELFPRVTGKMKILGHYGNIPVAVAIGDNQASFLGSVGQAEGVALANFGTGSQISVLSWEHGWKDESGELEVRPFLEGTYLVCGSALCGGKAYALLEQFFRSFLRARGQQESNCYDVLNQLAEEGLKRKDLPKMETTFCGTRQDPRKRGSITGLGEDNFTADALAAATLQGMAAELLTLFRKMPAEQVHTLVLSGNAVRRNLTLCRTIESQFALPTKIPSHQEQAAFGAAFFAAKAVFPQWSSENAIQYEA